MTTGGKTKALLRRYFLSVDRKARIASQITSTISSAGRPPVLHNQSPRHYIGYTGHITAQHCTLSSDLQHSPGLAFTREAFESKRFGSLKPEDL